MLRPHSIVKKMIARMSLIVVILLATLISSNLYSLEVVRKNVVSSSENAMAIYISEIQNRLHSSSKDLLEVFDANIDTLVSYAAMDENKRVLESIRLQNVLSAKLSNNESIDTLFIHSLDNQVFVSTLSNRKYRNEGIYITDYLKQYDFAKQTVKGSEKWTPVQINGTSYVMQAIDYSNVIFGVLIKTDTLLTELGKNSNDENLYILTDHFGHTLSTTNPIGLRLMNEETSSLPKYVYVSQTIPEFGQITNAVVSQNVFLGLETIQWIIVALSLAAVLVIPVIYRFFSKDIIHPILELVKGTKEIEKGNWEHRIDQQSSSVEFNKLFHAFSSMAREIKSLKIKTYEEKIERSIAELKYLQMQIRPHFFLNAITTVSSLTYHGKNEEIRLLIDRLSVHLRYMFHGGLVKVPVSQEIKHVENYIRMQEIRYPDQVFYVTDIDPELSDLPLPKYMIQTFVENSFKHALAHREMLTIFIKVDQMMLNNRKWLRITIEDNGEGFPPEVIELVQNSEMMTNEMGDKVGIGNIQRTLKLLYKEDGLLKLSNCQPSGARVVVVLPLEETDFQSA
ncbi:sensor histidine kinase [Marinicrinis lubricantis]|uniref:Sensor histidine kinase n=1 Tax=Marinicrinis lubricantis TaxID=2086470 RepID=A0ABW1IKM4_9BACL